MIDNKTIQQQLLDKMENNSAQTKVIQLNRSKANNFVFRPWQVTFPSLSKLISAR